MLSCCLLACLTGRCGGCSCRLSLQASRNLSPGVVQYTWDQDKTQFTPHVETGQNCLDLSPIQSTPRTRTRQDKTVLSCFVRVCGVN